MESTRCAAMPEFGWDHFGAADLGHKKRNECLVRVANALMRHPEGTLPDKLQSPADYQAMIRLANRPEVSPAPPQPKRFSRTSTGPSRCCGKATDRVC
jgi:Transposase DNA-binding